MTVQSVTLYCDVCDKPVTTTGEGNFLIAHRHAACALFYGEAKVTVKELHTFTDAEIETITDALRIANGEYRKLAELVKGTMRQDFRVEFEEQARAASDLQLKIEASR